MVLVSEPVRGRSRATELPCLFLQNVPEVQKHIKIIIDMHVPHIFLSILSFIGIVWERLG